ncbi:MAG: type II secretion system F family protein [Phycisphaerae bacterium]|nr:type II secretion system F family protein [Phycisphaerae bacterium]
MKLAYEGFTQAGRPVADVVEAPDPIVAADELRKQGLFVTRIDELRAAASASRHGRRWGRGSLKEVVAFTRQLSVLVGAGTPLIESLMALERQSTDGPWRMVIADLRERVEGGSSLGAAMEAHAASFDPVSRSLITAGEASGLLKPMLDRLATLSRRRLHARQLITGALVYPALLVVIACCVLSVMLFFVLPRFAGMFRDLNAPLPPTTRFLLGLSDMLIGWWPLIVPAAIAALVALFIWTRSAPGQLRLHRVLLAMPMFGPLARAFLLARVSRILGVLIEAQVPLLDAIGLTRQAAGSPSFEALLDSAREAVVRGEGVSAALRSSSLVPPMLSESVRTGEATGKLGVMLLGVADTLDEDNEIVLKSLTSVIEPVILIVLGVLVGLVAFSMFMPLFDLTAATSGGGGA